MYTSYTLVISVTLYHSTMPRTGINPYTLNHFHRVANAMNHYVAASAYNYYSGYDGIQVQPYSTEFFPNAHYNSHFGGSSDLLSITNLGSLLAKWIHGNL
ncbi:unnamed protein product [Rotaria magnacalcarata]|uniref:Uncharacterized protein n=1 Tax=Rotaria magnacalcarata TaxID=392030 RepID=A0A816TBP8_9BILA|nr:unnamed protein product [Rotaria magnacalcarata]CAF3958016.1 unnamed protein product [Rotaria magnacalcarata]